MSHQDDAKKRCDWMMALQAGADEGVFSLEISEQKTCMLILKTFYQMENIITIQIINRYLILSDKQTYLCLIKQLFFIGQYI
jgi:hypothetical protein